MKAVRLDALIFDLDGTLADSLADIGGAMNRLLATFGLPSQPLDHYRQYVGEGAENLVRRTFLTATGRDWKTSDDVSAFPKPVAELTDAYRAQYAALEHEASKPYPGIEAMLDGVVARRRRMAVLSNKRDDFTKHLVQHRFARWPFVAVRGEQEGVPRKPAPTAALELALALNVLPERIGFVGDTPIDVLTARNAGMVPIAVTWGFRSRDELSAAGAKHLLDRPDELLALLDGA
ncbi:MAG: HAD family hydrolase [Myxococcota bacterium]